MTKDQKNPKSDQTLWRNMKKTQRNSVHGQGEKMIWHSGSKTGEKEGGRKQLRVFTDAKGKTD